MCCRVSWLSVAKYGHLGIPWPEQTNQSNIEGDKVLVYGGKEEACLGPSLPGLKNKEKA